MICRAAVLLLTVLAPAFAADPPNTPEGPTVIDAAGKKNVLKKWSLSAGTRPLSRLTADGKTPEALAFRELGQPLQRFGIVVYDEQMGHAGFSPV